MFSSAKDKHAAFVFGLLVGLFPVCLKADITAGYSQTQSCLPFYCTLSASATPTIYYQEYFGQGWFTGPSGVPSGTTIKLTSITFPGMVGFAPQSVLGGQYAVSLGVIDDAGFGLPEINPSALNLGMNPQTFYSGGLTSSLANGDITITGAPYSYTPASNVNLLLTIIITNQDPNTVSNYSSAADSNISTPMLPDPGVSRSYLDSPVSTSGPDGGGEGLVARFSYTEGFTPEPSFYGCLGLGLCALLFIARRRSTKTSSIS